MHTLIIGLFSDFMGSRFIKEKYDHDLDQHLNLEIIEKLLRDALDFNDPIIKVKYNFQVLKLTQIIQILKKEFLNNYGIVLPEWKKQVLCDVYDRFTLFLAKFPESVIDKFVNKRIPRFIDSMREATLILGVINKMVVVKF